MRKHFFTTALLLCIGWAVQAQDSLSVFRLDEVIVTGTKAETTIEKSGKTIAKLSRQDIESSEGKTVSDLLNEIPGVQIEGNFGPVGTNISYRIRGAASRQSLILIDGVPFNDPSGISQTFDLRYLDIDQIESIEVLKGGLSTLYGTGAAAGVINITLKDAAKESFSGSVNAEYGSFNTIKTGLNLSGTSDALSYSFNGGYQSSDGFSAARDQSGTGNFDDDGFEGLNFLGKVGYDFTDAFSLGFTASIDDIEYDFDGGSFTDNDAVAEQQQLRFGLSPKYSWGTGKLKADLFYSKVDRLFNSPDFFDPTARSISELEGKTFQFDALVDQNLTDEIKLIGGINYQDFSYSQPAVEETSFSMIDPYVSFIYERGYFNLQLGGRLNNHSEYGSNFVWNVNPSYLADLGSSKLKVKGSYSTSFITPSLFQLLNPNFGNGDLDPESSRSIEGGLELLSNEKFTFGAVYFYREDEDAIGFRSFFDDGGNFTGGEYFNIDGSSEVDGVEISGLYSFTPSVSLSGHYTYLNSRTEDQILFRVPQDKFGFSLSVIPIENASVKLTHLHVGETTEASFPENLTVDAYDLFDLFTSYKYESFTFSLGVNNLLDEEYEPIAGFNSIGRNYTFGVRYGF